MSVNALPIRVNVSVYSGDDLTFMITFTDSAGAAYAVTAADFTATIARPDATDVTLTVGQSGTNGLTISAASATLGTAVRRDTWTLRNTPQDRTWLGGVFRVSEETASSPPVPTSADVAVVDGQTVNISVAQVSFDGDPGSVTSVNGQAGVVALDADDIDDTATTNKFATAAELTKLAGIETGATADQTAAEILAALLTVDGAGSGLDADLLDGLSSAAFETAGAVTAHTGDAADAHDASAISIVDSGNYFTGTDVEAALQELGAGGGGGGGSTTTLLHVRDEKAAGTHAGASTTSWSTRTLNTVKTNEITGASLASNTITLPAGTYEIDGSAPQFGTNRSRARLYDVTGAAVLIYGTGTQAATSASGGGLSHLRGRFTLTVQSDVRVEQIASTATATYGFGHAGADGTNDTHPEVFTEVMIRKVS